MNNAQIVNKSRNLADKVFDCYRNNGGLVAFELDDNTITFRVRAMETGILIEFDNVTLLYIKCYGIYNAYFVINQINHILVHFFNLIQLNSEAFNYNPNSFYVHQRIQRTVSRESIQINDFDWSRFKNQSFKSQSKEYVMVSEHPDLHKFIQHSYPDLGRGSVVANFYGIEDTSILKVGNLINDKSSKECVVIHTNEYDSIAMVVKNTKVLKDCPLQFIDSNIKYLINQDTIDSCWDALFPINRVGIRRKKF